MDPSVTRWKWNKLTWSADSIAEGERDSVRVTNWTLEPLQLVPVLLLAAPTAARRTLRHRAGAAGLAAVLFGLGIFLLVALVSPIDDYGESSSSST